MDALTEHLHHYWKGYVALLVCVLPVLYLLRKQLVPIVGWACELLAYMAGLHVVIFAVMHTAAWFKYNTRMYWDAKTRPDWHMPLLQVWKHAEYNPGWVFYLELAALVAVIVFMIRYRPMRIQKGGFKREHVAKGASPKAKPPASRWDRKGKRRR
ncbi:MAG: hypothetical protein JXR94_01810 [Candidatus Hydrogenedentes bacterium]|nr:hypothetical protein [Candidatus Hydrogenedentota bacterium]